MKWENLVVTTISEDNALKPVISRIAATDFRSLRHVDVTLGPLSVLVGPNGSGKTNLLKVIQFIANSARYDLNYALDLWGGFDHVARQGLRSFELEIEGHVTEFASEMAPDSYRLRVTKRQGSNRIQKTEELQYKRVQGPGRRITVNERNVSQDGEQVLKLSSGAFSGLGTLARLSPDVYGPGPSAYLNFLTSILYLDPDVEAARRPSRIGSGRIAEDASNLADALFLLSRDTGAFQTLINELKMCLPGLEDITFTQVGGDANRVTVNIKEAGLKNAIPLADASFGTVRMLSLLTALHDPNPPRMTVVEELDHGLHPYALDVLVDRMRAASYKTQLIAATHSPTLVNRLEPSEIIICDRDPASGESEIPARDAEEISRALGSTDLGLGELWFGGALGGVPD